MYKPHTPYNVPFRILTPTESVTKGVREKSYQESQTTLFCSFRTFGGSESTVNGVVDTATLETWYTPELTAAVQIRILPTDGSNDTGELYEVLGTPENIEMRNQYLLCKVKKITGGA